MYGPPDTRSNGRQRAELLLLHGIPTSERLWDSVAQHLSNDFERITIPNLPGWGDERPLAGAPTPDAHIEWLARRCERPRNMPRIVVGHDYGGLLALKLLVAGRADAAMVMSAWAGLGWTIAKVTALPPLHRFFYDRFGGRLYIERGSTPRSRGDAIHRFGPRLNDPELSNQMRTLARSIPLRRLVRLPRQIRACGRPVACIWGDSDPFIPAAVGRCIARQLKATFHPVPDARHLSPLDRPDHVASCIRDFARATQT